MTTTQQLRSPGRLVVHRENSEFLKALLGGIRKFEGQDLWTFGMGGTMLTVDKREKGKPYVVSTMEIGDVQVNVYYPPEYRLKRNDEISARGVAVQNDYFSRDENHAIQRVVLSAEVNEIPRILADQLGNRKNLGLVSLEGLEHTLRNIGGIFQRQITANKLIARLIVEGSFNDQLAHMRRNDRALAELWELLADA